MYLLEFLNKSTYKSLSTIIVSDSTCYQQVCIWLFTARCVTERVLTWSVHACDWSTQQTVVAVAGRPLSLILVPHPITLDVQPPAHTNTTSSLSVSQLSQMYYSIYHYYSIIHKSFLHMLFIQKYYSLFNSFKVQANR